MLSKLIRIGLIVIAIALLLGNLAICVESTNDPKKCRGDKPDECNGHCVNFQNDEKNCGSCGNVCRDGEVCQKGECVGFNNNKGISNNINVININKKATCTDGVMNGGETGVDCGGPCKPCPEKVIGNITNAPGRTLKPIPGIGNISAGPAQNAPGTPNPTYKFVIDTVAPFGTRSPGTDNDFISFGVKVGNEIVDGAPKEEFLGFLSHNPNQGRYPANLEIGPVPIPNDPNFPVTIAFLIVNSGQTDNTIAENVMNAGTEALINSYIGPGSPTAAPLAFVNDYLGKMNVNYCDGPVAADKIITNGQKIAQWAAENKGPESRFSYSPGIDSPPGCGENSQYYVYWHVEKVS